MAKRKRTGRATNKVNSYPVDALTTVDPQPSTEPPPPQVYLERAKVVARSTLFSAEFERVIEVIARDRVYRAMLAARRLLAAPPQATIIDAPPKLLG